MKRPRPLSEGLRAHREDRFPPDTSRDGQRRGQGGAGGQRCRVGLTEMGRNKGGPLSGSLAPTSPG